MKTHPHLSRREGNVLIICLLTCALLGFAIASCFVYVRNQMVSAARSQSWNESLVISEAGIEEGMMLINKYSGTTIPRGQWTNDAAAGMDSWNLIANSPKVFSVQRAMNGASYQTYVTNNTDGQPTIRTVGLKQFSGGQVEIGRVIVVKAAPGSLFQGGLIAKGGIELKGNILVDSFNSQLAGANINGQYDPTIRRDNGSVASASSDVVAEISANGSIEVYGKIYTGPEDSFINKGQATVGSEAFVDGTTSGVESGFVQNDLNLYIPDAPKVDFTGLQLPAKGTFNVGSNAYANAYPLGSLSSGGKYQVKDLDLKNSEQLVVQGNVKLYVEGSFSMGAQNKITISPNSSLTIYAGGSVDLAGQGVVNLSGYAKNLTINGLNTCTSIKYSGSSGFVGTIYAPYANVELVGGGSSDVHFAGSVVANSIKVSGHTQVHYDESLLQIPAGPHYYAISWKEVPLQKTTTVN